MLSKSYFESGSSGFFSWCQIQMQHIGFVSDLDPPPVYESGSSEEPYPDTQYPSDMYKIIVIIQIYINNILSILLYMPTCWTSCIAAAWELVARSGLLIWWLALLGWTWFGPGSGWLGLLAVQCLWTSRSIWAWIGVIGWSKWSFKDLFWFLIQFSLFKT